MKDNQTITLTIDRALYIRSIEAHIDLDALLAAAIEAELKRIEAEPKPDIDAEFEAIMERHGATIRALADR